MLGQGLANLADYDFSGYGETPSALRSTSALADSPTWGAPVAQQSNNPFAKFGRMIKRNSDWGNDPIMNEKIGSTFKGGLSALGGILDQGESDDASQAQYATNEDMLARQAYEAKRRASAQSRGLASMAGI